MSLLTHGLDNSYVWGSVQDFAQTSLNETSFLPFPYGLFSLSNMHLRVLYYDFLMSSYDFYDFSNLHLRSSMSL